MGDMPSSRIVFPDSAFFCVGLDFTGPLTCKNGNECVKGYVAVFAGFATKSVHLETVSSLTSDTMVAVLRRFIARRNIPSQIVSDNATKFVGARRDLIELEKVVKAGAQSYSSIECLFIPHLSPNFGGLWEEAAVKSIKRHLRKVMGLHSQLPRHDNDLVPNRASYEQSSTDGSHKQPRRHPCAHRVDASQW